MDEAEERRQKQTYLVELLTDGFDQAKFNNYLMEKKGPGFDFNSVTLEELKELVNESQREESTEDGMVFSKPGSITYTTSTQ